MDEVKIELARGVQNVRFRVLNLHDWIEPLSYDAV
jgi:hypothetical protein